MTFFQNSDAPEHFIDVVFKEYNVRLLFYATQILGNEQNAEDVVQEVYIKVFENRSLSFENEIALRAYLFRSIRNAALDRLEKKDVLRYHIDVINQEVIEDSLANADEEILTQIRTRINLLPPQTRKIITAVFLHGKKYQEVANELGISLNTVKTMLRKGMNTLRKYFKGKLPVQNE